MLVYCPEYPYPSIWDRLVAFGRKNKPKAKKQTPRKIKGRVKPPHRGGKTK